MAQPIDTLEALLAPMTPDEFFRDYYDRKPVLIRGGAEKFAAVMNWSILSDLLNMTAIWSATSLGLVLDRQILPPDRYCRPATSRDGHALLQPDAARVGQLLREGASLVANDIDALTPALRALAGALEEGFGGKAQANLYCSRRERQAFDSHFDTHDVFAVHVEGEKLWNVYETRVDHPIAHAAFKALPQAHHDKAKGKVLMQVAMTPGDLLYVPRGQYHDALSQTDGCIHIAFGVTNPIGVDLISMLFEQAIADPQFRRAAPRGRESLAAYLKDLGARLERIASSEETLERYAAFQRQYRYPRGGFDLPADATAERWRVAAKGLRVERRNGAAFLATDKGAAPAPAGTEGWLAWIAERDRFDTAEIVAAFPAAPRAGIERFLADLRGMKVLARA